MMVWPCPFAFRHAARTVETGPGAGRPARRAAIDSHSLVAWPGSWADTGEQFDGSCDGIELVSLSRCAV